MGDIHNLQVLIAQQPLLNRLESPNRNGLPNGGQIISVVNEQKNNQKLKEVDELVESEKTEKENSARKRKSQLERKIDLYL